MRTTLKQFVEDHAFLLRKVSEQAGIADPVAINLDEFHQPLMKRARKGELLPVDGVLVRDWDPDNRRIYPGIRLGMRLYAIDGIRFVRVRFGYNDQQNGWGLDFVAVDRKDYRHFYRLAPRCRRDFRP